MFFFSGQIEAIEFTKDSKYLIVSVRDKPYLSYVEIPSWNILQTSVNEPINDPHVSFNILSLNLSPDGKQLLACTDKSRAILFKTNTPIQIHNFYGITNDGLSQPRACFDNSGLLYLTSQDNRVHVFDIKTERELCVLSGHTSIARDIHYNPNEDLIVTAGYDKCLKIWKRGKPKSNQENESLSDKKGKRIRKPKKEERDSGSDIEWSGFTDSDTESDKEQQKNEQ